MEKRAFKRIPVKLQADFFYGDALYTGTVKDISGNGIYMRTGMCPPSESKFEILLPCNGDVLKIPVKVCRPVKSGDVYTGMGLEILKSSPEYQEFFHSLETDSASA